MPNSPTGRIKIGGQHVDPSVHNSRRRQRDLRRKSYPLDSIRFPAASEIQSPLLQQTFAQLPVEGNTRARTTLTMRASSTAHMTFGFPQVWIADCFVMITETCRVKVSGIQQDDSISEWRDDGMKMV